jgi:branched-chain amino acid transport system substrate-binding protein
MKAWILIFAALLTLASCDSDTPARQRAHHLADSTGPVTVAVAWPLKLGKASLAQGVDLAVEEINREGGVLNGRPLKILYKDDASSLSKGRLVAQEIADDLDVAAVIGHLNTYITVPASQIYERAGLVMITPGASGQKLTERGAKLVFRSLPGNRDQGRQIGDYAAAQGYKSVAIYYIKNDYGIDLANYFEQRAHELGITIADRRSYNMGGDNHAALLAEWAAFLKTDAVFLCGSLPESAEILRDARAAGLKVPVFGAAGLDSPDLIRLGGDSVEGTVVFALFNAGDPRPEARAFSARFRKRFGTEPDSTAAQGYDAVRLLAHAMKQAGSIVPAKVAAALRGTRDYRGVTGVSTFSATGDPVSKPLAKVIVKGGRFVYFENSPPAVRAGSQSASANSGSEHIFSKIRGQSMILPGRETAFRPSARVRDSGSFSAVR